MKKRKFRITVISNVMLAIFFTSLIFLLEFVPKFTVAKEFLMFGSIFSITSTAVAEYIASYNSFRKKNNYKSKNLIQAMGVGAIAVVSVFMIKIMDQSLYSHLISFSSKGGLWAISTALLFIILLGNQYEDDSQEREEIVIEKEEINAEREALFSEKKRHDEQRLEELKRKNKLLQKNNKSGKN